MPRNKSKEIIGKMAITLFPRESNLGFLARIPKIPVILEKVNTQKATNEAI
jgi:hypothetical protein